MGICSASRICDAAYLASRAQTYEDCCVLDRAHVWDDGSVRGGDSVEVIGEWLLGACRRYDESVPEHSRVEQRGREAVGGQGEM
eukprot:7428633-Karenia_brevis.AAC.1